MSDNIIHTEKHNYCTMFPDVINGIDISECCKKHDIAYSEQIDKRAADIELYQCVKDLDKSDQTLQVVALVILAGVWWFGRLWWYLSKTKEVTK